MKIRQKLILGFLVITVMITGVAVVNIINLGNLRTKMEAQITLVIPTLESIAHIRIDIGEIARETEEYNAGWETEEEALEYIMEEEEEIDMYLGHLDAVTGLLTAEEINDLKGLIDEFYSLSAEIFLLHGVPRAEIIPVMEVFDEKIEELDELIEILYNRVERDVNESLSSTLDAVNASRTFLIIAITLVVLTISVSAIILSKSITNPITKLRNAAIKLGSGDLGTRAQVVSKDEIGELATAFNQMAHEIEKRNEALVIANKEIRTTEENLRATNKELRAAHEERRKTDESLRESEEHYRTIFEATREGILTTNSDGRISSVNPAAINVLGYRKSEDLLGVDAKEIWLDPEKRYEVLASAGEKGYLENVEIILKRSDDTPVYVLANINVSIDDAGNIIKTEALFSDITERKKAEEELENLFNLSSDMVGVFTTEGELIRINPSWEKTLGYTTEELLKMGWVELIHPDDMKDTNKEVEKQLRGSSVVNFINRYRCKDGSYKTLEWRATFAKEGIVYATARDITERKKASQEIERAAKEWKTTFDSIPELISIHDKDFKILRANEAFCKTFRIKPEDIAGKTCFELLHGTSEPPPHCPYLTAMKTKKPSTAEYFEPHLGIFVEVSISPIFDKNGAVTACVHVVRDITMRKKAENAVKESLAEKELLLKEVHHRVKNNMQVISSLLKLQIGSIKDKTVIESIKETQDRIKSMALVYNKLYQSENLASIGLKDYVSELTNGLIQSYGGTSRRIVVKIEGDNIQLGVDLAIPCGLFINEMVTNSLKYAFPNDKNGEIRISLREISENEIEIIVSDNGVGIPDNVDFTDTKSLGLYLISTLVENQLSGKLELDRSEGTQFRISFNKNQ